MTKNEILLRKTAADLARSNEKITKIAVRKYLKGLAFAKDGNGYDTYDQRVEATYNFAREFAEIRLRRNVEKNIPTPVDRNARLFIIKRDRFMTYVNHAAFRRTAAGNHMSCVRFVDTPDQVKAVSWEGPGSIRNTNQVDSEHRYFIMSNWKSQVENFGLALLDSKLTLHAEKPQEMAGVQIFAATWVSQGEGCTLKTNRGHIAKNGEYSTHGNTIDEVVQRICGHRRLLTVVVDPVKNVQK